MICVFCKSTNFDLIYKTNEWSVLRCNKCQLVRTVVSKKENYQHYHRDEEYHQEEALFSNIFKKRYHLVSKLKASGKVLDIGASTGAMLDIFNSHGYKTYGIEPSDSYNIAKAKGHIVFNTTIEKSKLQNDFFDIVIINHTLEHVDDPYKVLQIVNKILKKDGIVYIDVPNFGSLSSQLAGKNWKYLLPQEHIHQFEGKTLSKLIKSSGFEIQKAHTWSGLFDVSNPVKLLCYKLIHFKKSFFTDLFGIPGNIIATVLNRGTNLVFIAKK